MENQETIVDNVSMYTLLPRGFMDLEKCRLYSLDNPVFLPDGREFLTWEKPFTFSMTYHVATNDPNASDENPGTESLPWKTIGRAAGKLMPGERVVIHEGIYREMVVPVRGGSGPDSMISYEGATGENVILRGSELYNGAFVRNGTSWRIVLPESVTSRCDNPFALFNYRRISRWDGEVDLELVVKENIFKNDNKLRERLDNLRQGLIFQNGKRLKQVMSEEFLDSDGTYWVEPDGKTIQLRPFGDIDPTSADFEYTVQSQVFSPCQDGLAFIRVKNLIAEFTAGYSLFPQHGAVSARRGHHWIIEDNIIRDCNSIGLDVGHRQVPRLPREFQMSPGGIGQIVRRNRIERCGICAIAGLGIIQGVVEDNVCMDTGWLDVRGLMESAAIKIHYNHHTIVRGNLVLRTFDAPGIWIDHSNHNVRCFENVIYGVHVEDKNNWGGGIFFEASRYHNLVDHNIIWNCDTHGLYEHDCENLVFANNLIGECSSHPFCLRSAPNDRDVHNMPTTGLHNSVVGNLFYASQRIPQVTNPENESDSNLFIEPTERNSSIFNEWREESGQDKNSHLTYATLELSPETWTLTHSSLPELPDVKKQKAITFDFLGTALEKVKIPCGPFAMENFETVINLKNPRWLLS